MAKLIALLCMISLFGAEMGLSKTMTEQFHSSDLNRIKANIEAGANTGACSVYYAVLGLSALETEISDKSNYCTTLKSATLDTPENTFCAVWASKKLSCPIAVTAEQTSQLKADLKDKSSVQKLYFSYGTLHALNKVSDVKSAEVVSNLKEALKTDDSAPSYGYAFHLASLLSTSDAASFLEYVEDIVAQADEVGGDFLQFESAFTTALVVEGALSLSDRAGKAAPGLSGNKIIQFANYLLSRRFAAQVKTAGRLASAIATISKNSMFRPLSVAVSPDSTSLSDSNKRFKVIVTDVLGNSPKSSLTVTVESAKHAKSGKSLFDKKPMKLNELGVYELEVTEAKPESGLYNFNVKVASTDKKFVGISETIQLESRFVTPITVASAEIGVIDTDTVASSATLNAVTFPGTYGKTLDADQHQRLLMKFQVKDSRLDKAIKVHQAFVRFEHTSGREVIFVAEPESSSALYKFDLSVVGKAKEFNHLSGEYRMTVIVGDFAIAQSHEWHVANVRFSFAEKAAAARKVDAVDYKPKPEIKHMFREPEKRPAQVVSLAFTAICLAPLLLLFILWGKIGLNFSGMEFGISTLGFHGGLAAIFGLFGCFFLWMDMFTTVKYLFLLAIPTFVFGNRVLAGQAVKKA